MNFRELQKLDAYYMKAGAGCAQTWSESCNSALEIV